MGWTRKDLLEMRSLEPGEILTMLDTAASMKEIAAREIKKVPALRGKTVVNLFYEPSTRTRTSFEIAGKWLSADVINFSGVGLERGQGRELIDTAKNIEAMSPDVRGGPPRGVGRRRTAGPGAPVLGRERRRRRSRASDPGAARPPDDPREEGAPRGALVAIVGDIAHSRVARSNIHGMRKLGMTVTVAGPPTLIPPGVQELGVKVAHRLEDAIARRRRDHDAAPAARAHDGGLIPSLREYSRLRALPRQAPRRARPDVLIMHPGPVNRGVELAPEVADGPYSVILDQVANGVAVRMAVLYLLAGQQGRGGLSDEPADPERPRRRSRQRAGRVQDVLIEAGRIARVGPRPRRAGGHRDARRHRARWSRPGFIDIHVHLREPGLGVQGDDRERHAGGGGGRLHRGRVHGQHPAGQRQPRRHRLHPAPRRAPEGVVRVYPIGAVTRGLEGEELAELAELAEAGCVAFSDDGRPRDERGALPPGDGVRPAVRRARSSATPRTAALGEGGVMNEGFVSTELGLRGIPAAAEEVMVARDIALAELTGAPVHIAHVSTAGAVRLVRDAKARGVRVTAEVTPHHLLLTDEAVRGYDPNAKMAPPLRSKRDVEACREALADGTIDAIATDHAPHALTDKEVRVRPRGQRHRRARDGGALCLDASGPGAGRSTCPPSSRG